MTYIIPNNENTSIGDEKLAKKVQHPLTKWREGQELTLAAFGDKIGVSGVTVGRYESGERIPERLIMGKIAQVTNYDVTPNDIFGISAPALAQLAYATTDP